MSSRSTLPCHSSEHESYKADDSVVKTRMQSLRAKQEYRNALHCAYRIATEEGVLRFWKGTVPRLGRLIVSSNKMVLMVDERRDHLYSIRKDISRYSFRSIDVDYPGGSILASSSSLAAMTSSSSPYRGTGVLGRTMTPDISAISTQLT